jgi:ABC-type transport system involved in cytochrome bd biosynthesis fused ATPase/permease subunit
MKSYLLPVFVTTSFLLVYIVAIVMDLHTAIILMMFSISPVLILWMVFRVLKAKVDSRYTFEDRWYEDLD